MKAEKRNRLEAKGWKVGSPEDFLKLSPEEATLVEMKLSLSRALKQQRRLRKLSQTELAKRIQSSQSRVAKMEACDPSVSLELLVRAVLAAGATKRELVRAIAS